MTQQVTVVTVQDAGVNQNQVNKWSHGLFGCFDDCGECLLAWFFPCITFGMNARDSGYCCDGCCGAFCGCILFFCPGAFCAWWCNIRPNIRKKYRIPANCCADFWSILCCPCCALIQERQQCNEPLPSNTQVVVVQNSLITAPPSSYAPPLQCTQPQGLYQQYPQGQPQQYPQQYPQGAPQQYPQGEPQQYPQQYPQGAPQQYPLPGHVLGESSQGNNIQQYQQQPGSCPPQDPTKSFQHTQQQMPEPAEDPPPYTPRPSAPPM